MSKSERLLMLIRLLEENKSLHIQDMVNVCGVSHRTIYRDLNSLSKLNIPLTYNNGYKLSKESGIPFQNLSAEDIDLIKYAIFNNPLVGNDYFTSKFNNIEKALNSKSNFNEKVIEFEKQTNISGNVSNLLTAFFDAISNKKNIRIKLISNENEWHIFTPKLVKISGKEINCIVNQNGDIEHQTISFNAIADIKMEEEFATVR